MASEPVHRISRRFIQPITESNICSQLNIPTKFGFGHELAEVCTLKLRNGQEKLVSLVRNGGNYAFKDGWPEFVEYALADYYDFMEFTYLGHSTFEVTIFGHNGCEVRRRDSPDEEVINEDVIEQPVSPVRGSHIEKHVDWLKKKAGLIDSAGRAGARILDNPFFVDKISVFNLRRSMMSIPICFGREYLKCQKGDAVKLVVPDGRQWKLNYAGNTTQGCSLSGGFRKFATGVELEVGDICIFELIARGVMKVQVVPKSQV